MKNSLMMLMLVLTSAAGCWGAEAIQARLQKALFEEEANQNLDAAMAAYKSVLAGHEEERKVAATALFRLGECYRKLGRTNEAAAQYQKLLLDFGEQQTLTRLAEQNLFALGLSRDITLAHAQDGRALVEVLRRDLNALKVSQAQDKASLFLYSNDFVRAQSLFKEKTISSAQFDASVAKFEQTVAAIQERAESITDLQRSIRELQEQDAAVPGRSVSPSPGAAVPEEKAREYAALVAKAERLEKRDKELIRTWTPQADVVKTNRVQLTEARARKQELEKEYPGLLRSSAPSRAVNPRLRGLIEEQINIAEQQLAEANKKIEVGTQAPGDELPYRQALVRLRRELAATEEAPGGPQQSKLLEEEIQIAELNVKRSKDLIAVGRGVSGSELEPQRELLALRRELATLDNPPAPSASSQTSPSFEERIRAIAVTQQQNAQQSEIRRLELLIKESPDLVNAAGRNESPPLHTAILSDQLQVARFLLEHGADVDLKESHGNAPLHAAVNRGNRASVELLLQHHANVDIGDAEGNTPLMLAADSGFKAIAELLLAHKADVAAFNRVGQTALHRAVMKNRKEIVEVLLANHADVNARRLEGNTPLGEAIGARALNIARLLLDKGASVETPGSGGSLPLVAAVSSGNDAMVELLLSRQANPNVRFTEKNLRTAPDNPSYSGSEYNLAPVPQFSPLLRAAYLGKTSMVQQLLKAGAETNAVDGYGATALLWAVRRDRLETVQLLISAGADPNLGAPTELPLGTAIRRGQLEVVRMLLERGADTRKQELRSGPPLHVAVARNDLATVELLLERGADVNGTDMEGRTALDRAKGFANNTERIELLRRHGANEYVPRPGVITSCRISRNFSQPVFLQSTNDHNHYTLVELIWATYQGDPTKLVERNFPDLANLRLSRRDPKDGQVRETRIDLEAILASGDPARDLPLQWGDVVEVPESDHRAQEPWTGFSVAQGEAIKDFLTRRVEIIVKGETNHIKLNPIPVVAGGLLRFNEIAWPPPGAIGGIPIQFASPTSLASPPRAPERPGSQAPPGIAGVPALAPVAAKNITAGVPTPTKNDSTNSPDKNVSALPDFRLHKILFAANVLRVSSDLSRVRVTRIDPATSQRQEMLFDYTAAATVNSSWDLWLHDGDIIQVPEK